MALLPTSEIMPPLCAVVDVRLMISPAVVSAGTDAVSDVVSLLFLQPAAKIISNRNSAGKEILRK